MHFEFDLVQGMLDDMPDKSSRGEFESDGLLMNHLCDNSLKDQLTECAIDDSMPDLDVFLQPSYPSPNRDDEMEGEADQDSGLELDVLLSPTAGDLPISGATYEFDLSDIALGSPCSQASSDNLMQEFAAVGGLPRPARLCLSLRSRGCLLAGVSVPPACKVAFPRTQGMSLNLVLVAMAMPQSWAWNSAKMRPTMKLNKFWLPHQSKSKILTITWLKGPKDKVREESCARTLKAKPKMVIICWKLLISPSGPLAKPKDWCMSLLLEQ